MASRRVCRKGKEMVRLALVLKLCHLINLTVKEDCILCSVDSLLRASFFNI